MEEVLQSKLVQEIALSSNGEIPEQFIHKDGFPQSKVDSVSYMDDFVIDLSLVFSPSSPEYDHELGKLQSALSQWGCFQAINHGMTNDFLDKVREVGKQFFALPLEEKQKYSRDIDDWNGYGNDEVVSKQQTLDWMDRLYLTVNPEDQRKLKYWPEKPVAFREIIHEYTSNLRVIFELLMKAMARSLNLDDDNCFLKEHGDSVTMFTRFNFYPPCPTPESILGIKPHADGVTFTVVLQDKEVEGLQVLKDDQWFKVPIVPDALFINVGDILEIMSNGILKSPVHRVVTNSEKERLSVVMFCSSFDREIGPIAELITQDRPQIYKRVRHYEKIFFENYQNGKRPLHAVRI